MSWHLLTWTGTRSHEAPHALSQLLVWRRVQMGRIERDPELTPPPVGRAQHILIGDGSRCWLTQPLKFHHGAVLIAAARPEWMRQLDMVGEDAAALVSVSCREAEEHLRWRVRVGVRGKPRSTYG